ncbi:MAG: hypothetical protein Q4F72_08165 [Desulfovibrionaceae bacterium]|nr:hypothetical protein [Desulfovibrionaceae bacterium]
MRDILVRGQERLNSIGSEAESDIDRERAAVLKEELVQNAASVFVSLKKCIDGLKENVSTISNRRVELRKQLEECEAASGGLPLDGLSEELLDMIRRAEPARLPEAKRPPRKRRRKKR